MAAYYPVLLKTSGTRCVVIGGGEVAERKVRGLLEAGAAVRIISLAITQGLLQLEQAQSVEIVRREYRYGDIMEDVALVFAATDDAEVNRSVVAEARQKRVPVNVADDPDQCDFILPSVLRRGDLVIAISTSGRSPALARRIREDLERQFPEEYEALCGVVSEARNELRRVGKSAASEKWQEAIDPELVELVKRGDYSAAVKRLLSRLSRE